MRPRVVITGMGIQSPVGSDPRIVLQAIAEARGGVGPIRWFDATDFVAKSVAAVADFDPFHHFSPQEVRTLDRATQMAVVAAGDALRAAAIDLNAKTGEVDRDRIGISIGASGAGQFEQMPMRLSREQVITRLAAQYYSRTAPQFQAYEIARRFQLTGPRLAFGSASAGSAIAIGAALNWLRAGKADMVLAGGAEALTLLNMVGMDVLGLSTGSVCSPFAGNPGMTFGEGAAFFVLETSDGARKRGAQPIAEILGCGVSADAYDPISNDPSGEGLGRAMAWALFDAGVDRAEIDWIKASGTGHRDQDVAETMAIKRLYEGHLPVPPVSSLEPFLGHANGASPAVQFLAGVVCQGAGLIPPTLNFTEPRPGCDLDYVPNRPRAAPIDYFLANSVAFGGVNTALVGGVVDSRRHRPVPSTDRVVITGVGLVSPIGCGSTEFVEGLRQGRCGIVPIDRFDVSDCRSRRAGLIREFQPRRLVPTLDLRRLDVLNQYAAVAAGLAVKDAGLDRSPLPPERVGVSAALSRGPVTSYEKFYQSLVSGGRTPAAGRLMLRMARFVVATQLTHLFRWQGSCSTLSEGVTAGLHALVHAFELLRQNDGHDAVVVVAADEIGGLFFHLLDRLGVLAEMGRHGETLCPYDPEASGMVVGEGAAALVLERARSAAGRGATALAEVAGYGLAGDGSTRGYLEPEPSGRRLERTIRVALEEAGIGPEGLDVVYGHGRGIPAQDQREAQALARVLAGRPVPVGCVLGHTGVAEATSGLFSVAAAVLGMARSEAYPVAGGGEPLAGGLAYVRGGPLAGSYHRALVAGSTENGNNAAVVLTTVAAGT